MDFRIESAVPVLRVSDVGRTIAWYRDVLGFRADPFPDEPPFRFAILFRGTAEIMVRLDPDHLRDPAKAGWDVYLRLSGGRIRELYAALQGHATIARRLEQMPYRHAEFEIVDPDGHRICLSEYVEDGGDLPRAEG